jgi:hypothetical protein
MSYSRPWQQTSRAVGLPALSVPVARERSKLGTVILQGDLAFGRVLEVLNDTRLGSTVWIEDDLNVAVFTGRWGP